MKLSELMPLDLESLRDVSMARAEADLAAGVVWPLVVHFYVELPRPVLVDGRHRVLVAMRTGTAALPAVVRRYGPRGGLRETRQTYLELDALPRM